jgi:hypothetical protein
MVGTVIKQGTFLIEKNIDGTFIVKLDRSNPADKITFIYKDLKEWDVAYAEAKNNPANREAVKVTEVKNLFEFSGEMGNAKTELNNLL